jgi:hypothetical protein
MIPRKHNQRRFEQSDLVTLPSGHKVPASSLRRPDAASRPAPLFERMPAVSGSIAGANSRFLHEYKKHRDKEIRRLAAMDTKEEAEKERLELERRKEERQRSFEEEAAKKRERRQKRKLAKSADGMPLPADIVKELKLIEVAERQYPVRKTSHPYALNAPHPVVRAEPEHTSNVSSQIRILDEYD